jgi:hypothetical protein
MSELFAEAFQRFCHPLIEEIQKGCKLEVD